MFDGATAYNAAKAAAEAKAKAEAEAAAKAAAEAAKPEPFADSAALKSAVDNCLAAVPSGLDCCKPKSEGGGGADCGAGKHAAIGEWDTSKVTSMNRLFWSVELQSTDRRLGYLQGHRHGEAVRHRRRASINRSGIGIPPRSPT